MLIFPVMTNLEADTIEEVLIVRDTGEVLRDLPARGQEHTVRHLHDISFVDGGNTLPSLLLSIVESIACNTLRGIPSNQLNGLDDAIDDLRVSMSW